MKSFKDKFERKILYTAAIIIIAIVLLNHNYINIFISGTEESGLAQEVFAESEAEEPINGAESGSSGNMQTVYGDNVADGEYDIDVDSSSSMFRITKAVLLVESGKMSSVITLSGKGYGKLFMGTGQEADEAGEDEFIPYEENAQGAYTYKIPVEFLNKEIACAAWSIKKEKWYDRNLIFKSDSLPEGVIDVADADADGMMIPEFGYEGGDKTVKTAETKAEDGKYMLNVELSGGSGKAGITSPSEVTVRNGAVWAKIEWSSPNYDYMIVDGNRYNVLSSEGNSVFEVPVLELDKEFEVIADTTAMGVPHEIEYTLKFDSSGFNIDKSNVAQNSKMIIIIVTIICILLAFIIGIFAGRKIAANKRQNK
ncbi:MAG: hypothetical protein HFE90_01250 [Firmicutes bacterium]|nr:hypothetical protein [Bacillota bacterium]